jgi:hypothetical protein
MLVGTKVSTESSLIAAAINTPSTKTMSSTLAAVVLAGVLAGLAFQDGYWRVSPKPLQAQGGGSCCRDRFAPCANPGAGTASAGDRVRGRRPPWGYRRRLPHSWRTPWLAMPSRSNDMVLGGFPDRQRDLCSVAPTRLAARAGGQSPPTWTEPSRRAERRGVSGAPAHAESADRTSLNHATGRERPGGRPRGSGPGLHN